MLEVHFVNGFQYRFPWQVLVKHAPLEISECRQARVTSDRWRVALTDGQGRTDEVGASTLLLLGEPRCEPYSHEEERQAKELQTIYGSFRVFPPEP